MEKLDGIAFSDQKNIAPVLDSIHNRLEIGLVYFLKSFLQDGFFHADLHGGNFFLLNQRQIGIIDYRSRRSRKNFIAIIYVLLTFNYENLVYEFLDVADYGKTSRCGYVNRRHKAMSKSICRMETVKTNQFFRSI